MQAFPCFPPLNAQEDLYERPMAVYSYMYRIGNHCQLKLPQCKREGERETCLKVMHAIFFVISSRKTTYLSLADT
jgi:hypothetical protein